MQRFFFDGRGETLPANIDFYLLVDPREFRRHVGHADADVQCRRKRAAGDLGDLPVAFEKRVVRTGRGTTSTRTTWERCSTTTAWRFARDTTARNH